MKLLNRVALLFTFLILTSCNQSQIAEPDTQGTATQCQTVTYADRELKNKEQPECKTTPTDGQQR